MSPGPEAIAPRRFNLPLIAIVVLQAAALYLPPLLSPTVFERDAQLHVWWTYRFADPTLFPNDWIADYFSRPAMAPMGILALYRMFVPWMDAQVFSELLPFVLAPVTCALAWLIGRRAAGSDPAGGTVACMFAAFVLLRYLDGGTASTFAPPILLLGIWALMADRAGWAGLSILSGAVFYPPIALLTGMTTMMVMAGRAIHRRRLPTEWGWCVAPVVVATGLIVAVYAPSTASKFGPAITAVDARAMPEFGPEGRAPFFNADPVSMYIESTRGGLGLNRWLLAGLAALAAVGAWRSRRRVPLEVWSLAASSLVLFAAAHFTLFTLHVPNRYLVYSFPVLIMMSLAAWLPRLRDAGRAEPARRFPGMAPWILVASVVAGVTIFRPGASPTNPDLESAYAFLRTLPADTLIAAHPKDADPIPLRTRRSVLVSREVALPFHAAYYRPIAERTHAALAAFYASDWAAVDALYDHFGVDVILVNRRRYWPGASVNIDEPFRHLALSDIARNRSTGFVLDQPPAGRVLFDCGDYLVVGPVAIQAQTHAR